MAVNGSSMLPNGDIVSKTVFQVSNTANIQVSGHTVNLHSRADSQVEHLYNFLKAHIIDTHVVHVIDTVHQVVKEAIKVTYNVNVHIHIKFIKAVGQLIHTRLLP